jgi:hypothetical protein
MALSVFGIDRLPIQPGRWKCDGLITGEREHIFGSQGDIGGNRLLIQFQADANRGAGGYEDKRRVSSCAKFNGCSSLEVIINAPAESRTVRNEAQNNANTAT